MKNDKKPKQTKIIIKGKFRHIHEGSPTGHPGMVYWKNDKRNLYLAFTTDSSAGTHRTILSKPTSSNVKHSYVNKRPLLAKRKDFGSEYNNMKFSKEDRTLLKVISRRKYRESPSIKSKDRRYLKKMKKYPKK